jgi:hypothetical protein
MSSVVSPHGRFNRTPVPVVRLARAWVNARSTVTPTARLGTLVCEHIRRADGLYPAALRTIKRRERLRDAVEAEHPSFTSGERPGRLALHIPYVLRLGERFRDALVLAREQERGRGRDAHRERAPGHHQEPGAALASEGLHLDMRSSTCA